MSELTIGVLIVRAYGVLLRRTNPFFNRGVVGKRFHAQVQILRPPNFKVHKRPPSLIFKELNHYPLGKPVVMAEFIAGCDRHPSSSRCTSFKKRLGIFKTKRLAC